VLNALLVKSIAEVKAGFQMTRNKFFSKLSLVFLVVGAGLSTQLSAEVLADHQFEGPNELTKLLSQDSGTPPAKPLEAERTSKAESGASVYESTLKEITKAILKDLKVSVSSKQPDGSFKEEEKVIKGDSIKDAWKVILANRHSADACQTKGAAGEARFGDVTDDLAQLVKSMIDEASAGKVARVNQEEMFALGVLLRDYFYTQKDANGKKAKPDALKESVVVNGKVQSAYVSFVNSFLKDDALKNRLNDDTKPFSAEEIENAKTVLSKNESMNTLVADLRSATSKLADKNIKEICIAKLDLVAKPSTAVASVSTPPATKPTEPTKPVKPEIAAGSPAPTVIPPEVIPGKKKREESPALPEIKIPGMDELKQQISDMQKAHARLQEQYAKIIAMGQDKDKVAEQKPKPKPILPEDDNDDDKKKSKKDDSKTASNRMPIFQPSSAPDYGPKQQPYEKAPTDLGQNQAPQQGQMPFNPMAMMGQPTAPTAAYQPPPMPTPTQYSSPTPAVPPTASQINGTNNTGLQDYQQRELQLAQGQKQIIALLQQLNGRGGNNNGGSSVAQALSRFNGPASGALYGSVNQSGSGPRVNAAGLSTNVPKPNFSTVFAGNATSGTTRSNPLARTSIASVKAKRQLN
jgi:hypothetical protein